jgi:hypothetical protein
MIRTTDDGRVRCWERRLVEKVGEILMTTRKISSMHMEETVTPKRRPPLDNESDRDAMQIDIPHELAVLWKRPSGEDRERNA